MNAPHRKQGSAVCGPVADEAGLELLPFDSGDELWCAAENKGDAVNTILAEAGEGVAATYLGDNRADKRLSCHQREGSAVLVQYEPRDSVADLSLRPPDELIHFLRDWLSACGAEK